MPLYMDIHNEVAGLTPEAVEAAHQKDLETQGQYGVNYRKAFCLVEAPDKDLAERVHREAHGLVADQIYEVQEGT